MLLGLIIVAVGTVILPATASAEESGQLADSSLIYGGTGQMPTVDSVMEGDLRAIAESMGITYAEAVEKYSWQNDFMAIVDQARLAFPSEYVTAEITHGEPAEAWIGFTSVPHTWIEQNLAGFPVPVEVREMPNSLPETLQSQAVRTVHYSVLGTHGVSDATSSIDPVSGQIEVDYSLDPSEDNKNSYQRIESAANRALGARMSLARSAAKHTLKLTRLATVGGGTETLYGGGQLIRNSDGAKYCTAGFTVTKNGRNGIITAKHCKDGMRYGSASLGFQSATADTDGDIRWLSTTDPIGNRVFTSGATTKTITYTGSPLPGATLSFYGRTTGASVDEVYKVNECSGKYCNLTMMHRHHTAGGDSGGPWTSGNVAYGVHHGYKTYLTIQRSLFTRVSVAESKLGVNLKLS